MDDATQPQMGRACSKYFLNNYLTRKINMCRTIFIGFLCFGFLCAEVSGQTAPPYDAGESFGTPSLTFSDNPYNVMPTTPSINPQIVEGELEVRPSPQTKSLYIYERTYKKNITKDSYKVWPELISIGNELGIDFSNPIFNRIYTPEAANRKCFGPQAVLLENKSIFDQHKRHAICNMSDARVGMSIAWLRNGYLVEDDLKTLGKISNSALSNKGDDSVVLNKVKVEDNVVYYRSSLGAGYFQNTAYFLIENEYIRKIGIKVQISVVHTFKKEILDTWPEANEKSVEIVQKKITNYKNRINKSFIVQQ